MKKQGKKWMLVAIALLTLAVVVLTGCGNVSNSSGKQNVDAKRVVTESVDAFEKMMGITSTPQANSRSAANIAPNEDLPLNEVMSNNVIPISGMNMYISEYLVEAAIFDFGTTYKDSFTFPNTEQSTTVAIRMENMDDGVVTKIFHEKLSQEVGLYFSYDYDAMKPLRTTCVHIDISEYRIVFIEFDYTKNEALYLTLTLGDENSYKSVQDALKANSFSFDTLETCNVESYGVAKVEVNSSNINSSKMNSYSYSYSEGSSSGEGASFGTLDEAISLFNEVYQEIDSKLLVAENLDFSTAEQKMFAEKMNESLTEKQEKLRALLGTQGSN